MEGSGKAGYKICERLYGDKAEFICGGLFSGVEQKLDALLRSIDFEWSSFNFETIIPNSVMIKEEEFLHISKKSIKAELNEYISSLIEEKAGKERSIEMPDVFLSLNFRNGRFKARPAPLYIFGRYKKEAGIAQSRWISPDGSYKHPSVEELVGERAKVLFNGKGYKLHASGREDIDARNTAGRPFVLELSEARKRKNPEMLNGVFGGVEISDAKFLPFSAVTLVSDSHFDKTYKAKLDQSVEPFSFENIAIAQKTPERVKHRRADIIRERVVFNARSVGPDEVEITAEAGTYIKEFISGDGGRTTPSLSELLGRQLRCTALEVVRIEDDFLRHLGL
ncbi:MAG: tRNA pseudouridine(54/55) synthase Pus10 [Candidatus Anstonellales archaeon]